ncbi:transporter [Weissella oryzae SG25]|uniref:Transporter n=1 Tax=Weissella oryzae (strain DSM 25784 / JCM 18191 / LMG 30913 / SG25) TaxID=1329250 RepID=A0A069CS93_WEIOS|nr:AI-2E family transporter [Weissella oryzae]GAK30299.1 transporter [Weissella oryzae SG25]
MEKSSKQQRSWLWRWVANNKGVSVLVIILLVLLIIFMLKQVSFIFGPVRQFLAAVGAPIILAGVFYYLLNPLVDYFEEKHHVKRLITTVIIFLVLAALLVWGILTGIPWFRGQVAAFLDKWPEYWRALIKLADHWNRSQQFQQLNIWLNATNQDLTGWFKELAGNYSENGVKHLTALVGTVTATLITLVTFPFILFYLLKDGHDLPKYMANMLPDRFQASFLDTLKAINEQIANYIRGQLLVALAVSIMFMIGYSVIGLPSAWLLALIAGILNLIPYLGTFLSMIPAYVVALFISPSMVVAVTVVFVIEQNLEGRVISPKLLGSTLKIHPVTVLLVLLSAGNMFGLMGVIFGIPGYAILKVLVTRIFAWWKGNSKLFSDQLE